VTGLAWSNDPESYDGSSIATCRVSHTRQVKGDDPDKKGYPGSPGWGLGVGLNLTTQKKQARKTNVKDRECGRQCNEGG